MEELAEVEKGRGRSALGAVVALAEADEVSQ
jgi:hypothetical protein